ncbi:hypothetical protein C8Q76DRAFT_247808 [Earliella scabrosa]|nr:hypothetical protein C8Q76DRAFT_247808 [Earliella scabrosa]
MFSTTAILFHSLREGREAIPADTGPTRIWIRTSFSTVPLHTADHHPQMQASRLLHAAHPHSPSTPYPTHPPRCDGIECTRVAPCSHVLSAENRLDPVLRSSTCTPLRICALSAPARHASTTTTEHSPPSASRNWWTLLVTHPFLQSFISLNAPEDSTCAPARFPSLPGCSLGLAASSLSMIWLFWLSSYTSQFSRYLYCCHGTVRCLLVPVGHVDVFRHRQNYSSFISINTRHTYTCSSTSLTGNGVREHTRSRQAAFGGREDVESHWVTSGHVECDTARQPMIACVDELELTLSGPVLSTRILTSSIRSRSR